MKPNCTNCTSYKPVPPEELWQGYPVGTCEHLKKKIWDVTSRNCDGLFHQRTAYLELGPEGMKLSFDCNDCGVQHG